MAKNTASKSAPVAAPVAATPATLPVPANEATEGTVTELDASDVVEVAPEAPTSAPDASVDYRKVQVPVLDGKKEINPIAVRRILNAIHDYFDSEEKVNPSFVEESVSIAVMVAKGAKEDRNTVSLILSAHTMRETKDAKPEEKVLPFRSKIGVGGGTRRWFTYVQAEGQAKVTKSDNEAQKAYRALVAKFASELEALRSDEDGTNTAKYYAEARRAFMKACGEDNAEARKA